MVGLLILGGGVGMLIHLDLGTDPLTAANTGLANQLGLSFGTMTMLAQMVMAIPVVLKRRDLIGLGTIIALFAMGYVIEYSALMWEVLLVTEFTMLIRVGLLLITLVVVAISIALIIRADLGITFYDALGFAVEALTGGRFKFKYNRIFTDALFVTIGFLFAAPIGVATLMTVVLIGPLVNFFKGVAERYITFGMPSPSE